MEFFAILIITFVIVVIVANHYINATTATSKENRDSKEVENLEEEIEPSENKT